MTQLFFYWLSDRCYDLSRFFDRAGYAVAPVRQLSEADRQKLVNSLSRHIEEHMNLANVHDDAAEHLKAHQELLND